MIKVQYLLFLSILILVSACTDPIEVGAGLLDKEIINLEFTDTLHFSAKTIKGDSVPTYRHVFDFRTQTHVIGKYNDDYFGSSEGIVYLNSSIGFTSPDFNNSVIDSIVLVLPYDTSGMYGDANDAQTIEVYQMDESLDDIFEVQGVDTLYTNDHFNAMTFLGSKRITPNYVDSFEVSLLVSDTVIVDRVKQHIRIPLDNDFGNKLLNDSNITASDSAYQAFIKGLVVKTDQSANALIGLNLINGGVIGTVEGSFPILSLYYTQTDDTNIQKKKRFNFTIGEIRHNEMIHDYSGSPAEEAIVDSEGRDYLYLQSMAGTNASFNISPAAEFKGKLINRAELEFTLAELPGDDLVKNYPINNLIAAYYNDNDELRVVEDIQLLSEFSGLNNITNIEAFFGGNYKEVEISGVTYKRYSFNITNHLINYIASLDTSNPLPDDLVFLAFSKQENVGRSIIYSPDFADEELQPKLKLVLTNP